MRTEGARFKCIVYLVPPLRRDCYDEVSLIPPPPRIFSSGVDLGGPFALTAEVSFSPEKRPPLCSLPRRATFFTVVLEVTQPAGGGRRSPKTLFFSSPWRTHTSPLKCGKASSSFSTDYDGDPHFNFLKDPTGPPPPPPGTTIVLPSQINSSVTSDISPASEIPAWLSQTGYFCSQWNLPLADLVDRELFLFLGGTPVSLGEETTFPPPSLDQARNLSSCQHHPSPATRPPPPPPTISRAGSGITPFGNVLRGPCTRSPRYLWLAVPLPPVPVGASLSASSIDTLMGIPTTLFESKPPTPSTSPHPCSLLSFTNLFFSRRAFLVGGLAPLLPQPGLDHNLPPTWVDFLSR